MPKKLLALLLICITGLFPAASVHAQETTTTYYFSPVFEKTDGVVTKYYPLAGNTTAMRRGEELNYLYADHLSSTRLVTNDQGIINNQFDYYPYGALYLSTSSLSTSRLYTNQILDSSTDLYFYNARQYNHRTASFISADSAQGPNRYAYVAGNPISRNDPSGNAYREDTGGGGGGSGNPSSTAPKIPDNWTIQISNGGNYSSGISATGTLSSQTLSYIPPTPKPIIKQPFDIPMIQYSGYYGYLLDFVDSSVKNLEPDYGVSSTITEGSEWIYASRLTTEIYKREPYSKKALTALAREKKGEDISSYWYVHNQASQFSDIVDYDDWICGDKATLLAYFLTRSGIPNELMYVVDKQNDFYHGVVSATIDSKIGFLDPTWNLMTVINPKKDINTQISNQYNYTISIFGIGINTLIRGNPYSMTYTSAFKIY